MTKEGWKEVIKYAQNDEPAFDLLAQLLTEQDEAKAMLTHLYGCTGMSWRQLIDNIIEQTTNV